MPPRPVEAGEFADTRAFRIICFDMNGKRWMEGAVESGYATKNKGESGGRRCHV
jgi:hypothetical protein